MCPGTLALVTAAASAAGAIGGGIASANAAGYQGQVAANNAIIARQNAAYSASAASSQTQQAGMKARAQGANVRTGLAANGLDVNSGSPAEVQVGQREIGSLDTATVAARGAEQVYGYQAQATGYDAQSKLDQSEQGWDIAGGVLKAGGDLLGNPSVDKGLKGLSSLLTGPSTVPAQFAWMQSGSTGAADQLGPGG